MDEKMKEAAKKQVERGDPFSVGNAPIAEAAQGGAAMGRTKRA